MPKREVIPVTTVGQRRQFLRLPWQLYENDPNWVPPLRQNQKELVGYKRHPFYDDALGQTFLALVDGKPCGRLLALVNHAHNRRYEVKDGFFGFFECINDPQLAQDLFDAAKSWLTQQGMQALRGPVNPSLNYEIGLLVDGFDSPPTFMMTYNPPYYAPLIEQAGFTKLKDLYAFWGHVEMLETLDTKLEFLANEVVERFKVKMRPMDRGNFLEEVRLFLDIYNRSLVGTWGFVPLSAGEAEHMAKALKYLIVPRLTAIAEIDGKPIGAMLALLDYNPRIKRIDGRLFPFGFLRLLHRREAISKARVVSANVVPEYQQWGVGLALLAQLEREVQKTAIKEAEFSWVLEDNHLSRKSLEHGGAVLQKTYRIYEASMNG